MDSELFLKTQKHNFTNIRYPCIRTASRMILRRNTIGDIEAMFHDPDFRASF